MNIQCRQQSDEGSSGISSNREANSGWVLNESEIKQDPKEEPFDSTVDDVLVVTFPHSDAWSFGNLANVKAKAYVKKIVGNETGQKVAMKPMSSKEK